VSESSRARAREARRCQDDGGLLHVQLTIDGLERAPTREHLYQTRLADPTCGGVWQSHTHRFCPDSVGSLSAA
jgi:hypothetical protein